MISSLTTSIILLGFVIYIYKGKVYSNDIIFYWKKKKRVSMMLPVQCLTLNWLLHFFFLIYTIDYKLYKLWIWGKIGGLGKIVEIDDSKCGRRKYPFGYRVDVTSSVFISRMVKLNQIVYISAIPSYFAMVGNKSNTNV